VERTIFRATKGHALFVPKESKACDPASGNRALDGPLCGR
jgi:hypothetical protein